MTFTDWAALRDHLIEKYGSTPHPSTEQEIIDAYQLHPDAVTKAGLDLIDAAGITSHWGLLKSKASKIARPPANPTHDTSVSREKRVARAEQWIRSTGCHYDRDSEIMLELFSGSGLLVGYAQVDLIEDTTSSDGKWTISEPAGDTHLVERMLKLYNESRPKGILIEEDAQARADKYRTQQAELRQALAQLRSADTDDYRKPLPDVDYTANPETDPEPVKEPA